MKHNTIGLLMEHARRSFSLQDRLAPALEEPIKTAIQRIAAMIASGTLEPCPRCEKDGIPRGYYRGLDAAGSSDDMQCPDCNGWTVREVRR